MGKDEFIEESRYEFIDYVVDFFMDEGYDVEDVGMAPGILANGVVFRIDKGNQLTLRYIESFLEGLSADLREFNIESNYVRYGLFSDFESSYGYKVSLVSYKGKIGVFVGVEEL